MPRTIRLLSNVWSRRARALGQAAAALCLGALVGCSNNGTGGPGDPNNPDGGSTVDMLSPEPPPGSVRLTVSRGGSGQGTVTSEPAGVSCGGSCVADFPSGTMVKLTAIGNSSGFSSWSGACTGQGAVCQLTLGSDTSVTANFDPLSCTPDGLCWEAPLPYGYDFRSVFALSSDDVWAVGNSGVILHFDGQSWKRSESGTTSDLLSVWARSKTEVYVAAGVNLGPGTSGIYRYDGTSWSKMNTSTFTFPLSSSEVNAVWGTGTNILYAVTNSSTVYRFDGTSWTTIPYTTLGIRNVTLLSGIAGTGPNDVIVYGDDQSLSRWNGSTWTASALPPYLASVVALSPTSAYGVTNQGKLYKSTGARFNEVTTATGLGTSGILGLWGTADNNLLTSGPQGLLYRFDGSKFSSLDTGAKDVYNYNAIHGASATDVWAVGRRGVLARYNGTTAKVSRGNLFSGDFISVWGSGPNDVFFLTDKQTVVHYDGVSFSESQAVVSGAGVDAFTIAGSGPTDVWLGAGQNGNGLIMRYAVMCAVSGGDARAAADPERGADGSVRGASARRSARC